MDVAIITTFCCCMCCNDKNSCDWDACWAQCCCCCSDNKEDELVPNNGTPQYPSLSNNESSKLTTSHYVQLGK